MEPSRPIMLTFDSNIFRSKPNFVDQKLLLEQIHQRQQLELSRQQELEKVLLNQQSVMFGTTFESSNNVPQTTFSTDNERSTSESPRTDHEGTESDLESRLSSSSVKQKLKECLLTRRHQQITNNAASSQPGLQWSSQEANSHSTIKSRPLPAHVINDFPIRKTSSEPNLKVKSALKQKVIERRSSPMLKRQLHKTMMTISSSQSNSLMSSPNSSTEEPQTPEGVTFNSINFVPAQPFSLLPDDLKAHTSLPNLNNCRATTNQSMEKDTDEDLKPPECRRPLQHRLNRTNSSPLLRDSSAGASSLQLAVQEQKLLLKQQLRQKLLIKNLGNLDAADKLSGPTSGIPYVNLPPSLERTASSPIMKLPSPIKEERSHEFSFTTALVYDPCMLSHQCLCGINENHPENPSRLAAVWQRLQDSKLVSRCEKVRSRKATLQELQRCHTETFTVIYGTSAINRDKINPRLLNSIKFCRLPCQGVGIDSDTIWNETHTASAARVATGSVIALASKIAQKEVRNGFALVRPPGHHAEMQQAMGFCYFNSIAVATRSIMQVYPDMQRVLIVDWDVHHGNGLQQIFYEESSVLYISLHRYDNGRFFPGTGAIKEVGSDGGQGYNVNMAWSCPETQASVMGDAEYLAAFRSVVMPLARQFDPGIIFVAAGFDGTPNHPQSLGGYQLSPAIFAWMTEQMMSLAEGRVVLVLEGGYDLSSLCDSVEACVRALMNDDEKPLISTEVLHRRPNVNAVKSIKSVLREHSKYWECLLQVNVKDIECSHFEALHPSESITTVEMAELSAETEKMEIVD